MKKYFVIYVCSIALLFCLSSIVYAYYVVSQETSDLIFTTGNLEYEFTSDSFDNAFIEQDIIIPGEELIKENSIVYIINKSSISSQLRIVIRVKVAENTYYVDSTNTNEIICTVSTGWVYDSTNQYWYYGEVSEEIPSVTVDQPSANINILSSLKLNGNYFGNAIATSEVNITIIYQSKQAEYAEWDNIEEININLGN